ncbi:MAG: hypothetical protein KAJ18_09205 [Candidatus Omnitrophica bacterium]|nr:hypothetical protein [Candidatus Omnitrophota bacterium]
MVSRFRVLVLAVVLTVICVFFMKNILFRDRSKIGMPVPKDLHVALRNTGDKGIDYAYVEFGEYRNMAGYIPPGKMKMGLFFNRPLTSWVTVHFEIEDGQEYNKVISIKDLILEDVSGSDLTLFFDINSNTNEVALKYEYEFGKAERLEKERLDRQRERSLKTHDKEKLSNPSSRNRQEFEQERGHYYNILDGMKVVYIGKKSLGAQRKRLETIIKILEVEGYFERKRSVAEYYCELGSIYKEIEQYDKAMDSWQTALRIFNELKMSQQASKVQKAIEEI